MSARYHEIKEVLFKGHTASDLLMALSTGGTDLKQGQIKLALVIAHPERAKNSHELHNHELIETLLMDSDKAANSKYELWRLEHILAKGPPLQGSD